MSGKSGLNLLGGVLLLVGSLTGALRGHVIYVDCDGRGANDGSSWADAYNFLQDALADASRSAKPVEIRVAEGVYRPDEGANQTPGNRKATFRLTSGITLKGRYAGSGRPNPDARDLDEYETILSGDLNGDDVIPLYQDALANEPSRAENAYHVVTGTGADQTTTFDGFTVTGGNANTQGKDSQGGGIYNNSATLRVTDCTFRANSAETGGAMYNFSSSPTLLNCTFAKNEAVSGGGIGNFFNSAPTLINCTFSNNYAYYDGGMTSYDCNVTLINCTFSGNNSGFGYAGGMLNSRGNATLESCVFNRNSSAGWAAGGIYNTWNSTLQLSNCTFVANFGYRAVVNDSHGQSAPSYLRAVNCIFWDGGDEIWSNDNSAVAITYSDVEGGWAGEGNIDADPRFLRPWPGGAVSYWRFDEGAGPTAYDSVGGKDGTIDGAEWARGHVGWGLEFDGLDDCVRVEHDAALDITGDITISAWVNFALGGSHQGIVTKCVGAGGRDNPFDFRTNSAAEPSLAFVRADSTGHERVYSSVKMALGQWHHVMVRVENNVPDFYVNGDITGKYADTVFTRTPSGNTKPVLIGGRDDGLPFNGLIDEVVIFNRALSGEEIRDLYEGGFGAFGDYHLLGDSPCINTGDPQFVAGPNDRDMDGESRVMLGRVDMGADELNPFAAEFVVVGRRRISRTVFEYECEVIVENVSSFAVRDLRLEMTNTGGNVVPVEPNAAFGDIEIGPGESATSLDTCTFTVDRAEPIDAAGIIWQASFVGAYGGPRIKHRLSSGLVLIPEDMLGDISGDGRVGFEDLTRLGGRWLWSGSAGEIEADIVRDGRVNMEDFAEFAQSWSR